MRILLPNPPFQPETLGQAFGFQPPSILVDVLNEICRGCRTAEAACDRVDETLGWILADEEQRYQNTPPELFPVAATGVDGGHFGYVIPAPELGQLDFPLARFEPTLNIGAEVIGYSTREAIELELSRRWFEEEDGWVPDKRSLGWSPRLQTGLAKLGIFPHKSKTQPTFGEYKPSFELTGWLHRTSSDGVGVFAPVASFSPEIIEVVANDVEATIKVSNSLCEQGYPASALLLLRESYWQEWSSSGVVLADLCRAMKSAYIGLGRPVFADVLDWRIRTF
jgi:hypothetical protein